MKPTHDFEDNIKIDVALWSGGERFLREAAYSVGSTAVCGAAGRAEITTVLSPNDPVTSPHLRNIAEVFAGPCASRVAGLGGICFITYSPCCLWFVGRRCQ
jgi:hypothetical protein